MDPNLLNSNIKADSFDMNGDLFVHAFNQGNYPMTGSSSKVLSNGPFGYNAIASSPEDFSNPNEHTPGSPHGDFGTGVDAAGQKLNPRSCVTCRRRKVRCDKKETSCSNCSKAHIECIYPPPGRAPRKPRRPHDAELLKRLRRLESVVDSLGAQVDEDGQVHEVDGAKEGRRSTFDGTIADSLSNGEKRRTSLEHGVGRLMLKDGRSRYVSNEFWSTLGEEIGEIRNYLDAASSEEEQEVPDEDANQSAPRIGAHQGFIFGYSSLMYDMSKLYPNPSQIFILWEIFKENVDPILKIVHVPTVKNVIMKAAVSSSGLSRASEALFYSICFSAVVSMEDDQCQQLLGETKVKLCEKYRFAVEQALARANFLNSTNLMVLQAFVLFITVVKFNDTSRSIWCLAGLAMQQAQAQGLHRDGSNFSIPPFETEMRRRLWWHISLQDARASEDYGADPAFHQHFFDTRLPLNVNDDDIWPEMKELPVEQAGSSDMTFCLVRFELAHMQRKLRIVASSESDDDKKSSIKEKEKLIDATHQHMQEKYFQYCDPNVPLLWVALTVGKLILAKMWLFVHHPRLFTEDKSQSAADLREQVFLTSVEVIEFGSLLGKGKQTSKWTWLFHTYNQWHAVAYVLSELLHRPMGPEFERAWNATEAVYAKRMAELPRNQRGVLWRPLKQLYTRARQRRMQLQTGASPNSDPDTTQSLSTDSQGNLTPSMGMMNDNLLGANPYLNAVSTTGDAFGLDFNDPAFNEVNMAGTFNFGNPTNPQMQLPMKTPLETIPFAWNPDVADYFNDFGVQPSMTGWTPQMQQEWH